MMPSADIRNLICGKEFKLAIVWIQNPSMNIVIYCRMMSDAQGHG